MNKRTRVIGACLLALLVLLTAACAAAPAPEAPPAEPAVDQPAAEESPVPEEPAPPKPTRKPKPKRPPLDLPADPPEPERTLADSDASLRAEEKRVLSGDNFLNNLYERPFTSEEMIYRPDLDIYTVDFGHDDEYFYFTINLNGLNEQDWALTGRYGIEFDLDLDGRGDMIFFTENPPPQWNFKALFGLVDTNEDVGGPTPVISDEDFSGDGYDRRLEFKPVENPAFVRLSPDDNQAVQFAISNALLQYPEEFLWSAWADRSGKKPVEFDYNDTMGPSEAGSPFSDSEDYPIKGLALVDNTCRLPYGFEQMGSSYPGMCITIAATSEPDKNEPDCYCNDYCVDGVTCCGDIICP